MRSIAKTRYGSFNKPICPEIYIRRLKPPVTKDI